MKKLLSCFVFAAISLCITDSRALAADIQATPEEIIAEVEKATGCSKDALDAVRKETPALFEKLGDAVTGIKVANLILEAKDTEALAEIAKWQIGKDVDAILKRVFPAAWLSALSAFKAYYSALELMRDHLVIPAFDERLYQAYKKQRSGAGGGSPEDAFTEATVLPASGYYLIKPSMLDKYIKSRGWKRDIIGDGVIKNAEKQIDSFWEKRLEARYQKDIVAKEVANVKEAIWAAQASSLAAIRAAAEKHGAAYPFFLTQANVDALEGYKFSQYTYWPPNSPNRFKPAKEPNSVLITQSFSVIPKGVTEKKREDGFPVCYGPDGKVMHNGPYTGISIQACPRMMSGVHEGKPYTVDILEGEKDLSMYSTHPFLAVAREIKEPGVDFGYLLRKASKDGPGGEDGHIIMMFTDKYRIIIGASNYNPKQPQDTESLVIQISRVMLDKMKK